MERILALALLGLLSSLSGCGSPHAGASCVGDGDCTSGEYCDFDSVACPSSAFVVVTGTCKINCGAHCSAHCSSNDDCPEVATCSEGRCGIAPCGTGLACPDNITPTPLPHGCGSVCVAPGNSCPANDASP
jgi:hypothetical protein